MMCECVQKTTIQDQAAEVIIVIHLPHSFIYQCLPSLT